MKSFLPKLTYSLLVLSSLTTMADDANATKASEEKKETTVSASYMDDFINRRPYVRDEYRNIPSPFRNLIVAEQIKQKQEEAEKNRLLELEKALDSTATNQDTPAPEKKPENTAAVDPEEMKFKVLQDVRQKMLTVDKLVAIRNYQEAEGLLKTMSLNLFKFKIEEDKEKVEQKRIEVEAERKDWDEINKILAGLRVQAMFVTAKNKKIALLNSSAVEVGDDLNVELNLNKDAPIILTHVSNNSIRIKFKKFELNKDIVDNE